MADATKTTACPIGHMTYTQAPTVCEKNIFHLFHFTQPVKNYSYNLGHGLCILKSLGYIFQVRRL